MQLPPNPWLDLPKRPPFVLKRDLPAIGEFNGHANKDHRIDVDLLPEPFLGSTVAPVVLLGLNPGWSPEDAVWHAKPAFARLLRGNLAHSLAQYPFYLLDPSQSSPGSLWWSRRLRALIERVGLGAAARAVSCVEYFPYHSNR